MATFLFAWNPEKWPWDNLPKALDQIASSGRTTEWWSCKSHKAIRPDDRAFLVRLGVEPKGIMASGYVVSEPFLAPHWSDKTKQVMRVDIEFDMIINPQTDQLLSIEQLNALSSSKQIWTPQASGTSIADDAAVALEQVWYDHVEKTVGLAGLHYKAKSSHEYLDGAYKQILSKRYERNPHARRVCVEHYGSQCMACGINFETTYGEIGSGFIHIHHLVPVSMSEGPQKVDPIKDLRPVCPNCHAMLHKQSPPMTIEALRKLLDLKHS